MFPGVYACDCVCDLGVIEVENSQWEPSVKSALEKRLSGDCEVVSMFLYGTSLWNSNLPECTFH